MNSPPLLLVGAGAAGISAALWLHDLAIPFRWIDASDVLGGTLLRVGNAIPTYPGLPADNGPALAAAFVRHITERGLQPELGTELVALRRDRSRWIVTLLERGREHTATWDAVLLATGTRPRTLGFPEEQTHAGRGIEISVTRTRERYEGAEVCVVGGGDAALEGALLLAESCPVVHLVHRRDTFRAQRRFAEAVRASPVIRCWTPHTIARIGVRDDRLHEVELDDGTRLACSGVFVRVGVEARIPEVPESLAGQDGYLTVDRAGRTPAHGLYAAGDVTGALHQSVIAAAGDGARAVASFASDFGYR